MAAAAGAALGDGPLFGGQIFETSPGTGSRPLDVAFGDLNGDGVPDAAIAHFGGAVVMLNSGDASFAPPIDVATGGIGTAITLGDLDNDGDLDIVFVNEFFLDRDSDNDGTGWVVLNNGDGTFAPATPLPTGLFSEGIGSRDVELGDVDGDGDLDIAVAVDGESTGQFDLFGGGVNVLLNQGDATFAPPTTFSQGDPASSLALGDVDNDGDLDIVMTEDTDSIIRVLENDGSGSFEPLINIDTGGVDNFPRHATLGDFDGDGDLDLAFAEGSLFGGGGVVVFPNNGDGSFNPLQDEFVPGDGAERIVATDLNDDGVLDIAFANFAGTITVALGSGDGVFEPATTHPTDSRARGIAAGDLDGDGDLDLGAVHDSNNVLVIIPNLGDGTYASRTDFPADSSIKVALADVNSDGNVDAVLAGGDVLLGNGDGSFSTGDDFQTVATPSSVAVGDLDGDGDLDAAITSSGSNEHLVGIFLNTGSGSMNPAGQFQIAGTGFFPEDLALADLDTDGDLDIVTANFGTRNISILFNNGDATFASPVIHQVGNGPIAVETGDLDGDGHPDIITANASNNGDASVLLNNGDGTFQPATTWPAGFKPADIALADIDDDGDLDAVITNKNDVNASHGGTEDISVLLNNGDATFTKVAVDVIPDSDEISGGPRSEQADVALDDVTGDTVVDLVVFNRRGVNRFLSVLPGNGDGTFQTPLRYSTSDSPFAFVELADLDGDGDTDLVTTSEEPGIGVLLNQAAQMTTPPSCPADLTGPTGEPDGVLDASDFFAYLGLFAAGDPGADLTGPTGDPDGVIDASDFFLYLNLFAAGCP